MLPVGYSLLRVFIPLTELDYYVWSREIQVLYDAYTWNDINTKTDFVFVDWEDFFIFMDSILAVCLAFRRSTDHVRPGGGLPEPLTAGVFEPWIAPPPPTSLMATMEPWSIPPPAEK